MVMINIGSALVEGSFSLKGNFNKTFLSHNEKFTSAMSSTLVPSLYQTLDFFDQYL